MDFQEEKNVANGVRIPSWDEFGGNTVSSGSGTRPASVPRGGETDRWEPYMAARESEIAEGFGSNNRGKRHWGWGHKSALHIRSHGRLLILQVKAISMTGMRRAGRLLRVVSKLRLFMKRWRKWKPSHPRLGSR